MKAFPEAGYTPANFKHLVKSTKLAPAAFQKAFNVPHATFYKWMNGQVTPSHNRWCELLEAVHNEDF